MSPCRDFVGIFTPVGCTRGQARGHAEYVNLQCPEVYTCVLSQSDADPVPHSTAAEIAVQSWYNETSAQANGTCLSALQNLTACSRDGNSSIPELNSLNISSGCCSTACATAVDEVRLHMTPECVTQAEVIIKGLWACTVWPGIHTALHHASDVARYNT